MSTSFDDRAKAAAERAPGVAGLSRRQLIQRGAFVVGTAWTAPMLLSATPAWAGASKCNPDTETYSHCANNTDICCPKGQACVKKIAKNGTISYGCDVPLGGFCTNYGNGECDGGYSRCNHLAVNPDGTVTTNKLSVCGGPGAYCDFNNNAVCLPDSPCAPVIGVKGARCGGEGAPCSTDSQCANGSTGGAPDLVCRPLTLGAATTCQVKLI